MFTRGYPHNLNPLRVTFLIHTAPRCALWTHGPMFCRICRGVMKLQLSSNISLLIILLKFPCGTFTYIYCKKIKQEPWVKSIWKDDLFTSYSFLIIMLILSPFTSYSMLIPTFIHWGWWWIRRYSSASPRARLPRINLGWGRLSNFSLLFWAL